MTGSQVPAHFDTGLREQTWIGGGEPHRIQEQGEGFFWEVMVLAGVKDGDDGERRGGLWQGSEVKASLTPPAAYESCRSLLVLRGCPTCDREAGSAERNGLSYDENLVQVGLQPAPSDSARGWSEVHRPEAVLYNGSPVHVG